jgi:non-canonical (house-cleaning) NTP pyrophosphatase
MRCAHFLTRFTSAAKRFAPHFRGYKQIVCAKKRGEGDERTVVYASGDVPAQTAACNSALIVDDLAQSGGTTAECARLLNRDFGRVSAFVVHAVFPNDAHKHFLPGGKHDGLLETFFVCNTNPSVSDVLHDAGLPFRVLDVAPLIADQLRRDAAPRIAAATVARRAALSANIDSVKMASSSAVKWRALQAAMQTGAATGVPARRHGEYRVFLRQSEPVAGCASRVAEQPLSEAETWIGAENRLAALLARDQSTSAHAHAHDADAWTNDDCIFVAIESGLWQRDGKWCDSACVVVERRGAFPGRARVISAPHEVPERYLRHVPAVLVKRGAVPLGQLVHAADPDLPADAWFERETQLRDAIALALQNV